MSLMFLCAALVAQPCAATAFQWASTGSLNISRQDHTATVLPDGQVLAVGGFGASAWQDTAELYNPATGNWILTGSLSTERQLHTATLLADGTVLVVAGYNGSNEGLASAELYDPAKGSWSSAGSLENGRYSHTATLLNNGKVLVAAGRRYFDGNLNSAQLYDPATGSWSLTGSLHTGRNLHTATMLLDGRVLVVGGFDDHGGNGIASTELYDPVTGTWSETGSLNDARGRHSATLLPNGMVLVAGGARVDFSDAIARAELYDPATGTWSLTGHLGTARESHTATLLPNGKVLVAGGESRVLQFANGRLSSAELYDPVTGAWAATGKMVDGRYRYAAALLPGGQVLVAAGYGNPINEIDGAELYDPGLSVPATVKGQGTLDIDGNQITFNFHAVQGDDGSTRGSFSFCDPAAGICLANAKFQNLSVEGNTAYFVGSATLDTGLKVLFNVSTADNGMPGTSDSISIMLNSAYFVAGPLISGDIRIR
jgi:Kelch motif/Galactose oxidase, central domain